MRETYRRVLSVMTLKSDALSFQFRRAAESLWTCFPPSEAEFGSFSASDLYCHDMSIFMLK